VAVVRVGVIHNLTPGGAHRRLSEQIARFQADVVEVCLSTATPIRADAHVIEFRPAAPRAPRALRGPLRYSDLVALIRAWQRIAAAVRQLDVGVVYANPCRFLQAPAALLGQVPPALYFCDEARRVDAEPAPAASRNPTTRRVYALMYAAERHADRRAVARASAVVTNSSFSAGQIQRVYGREAQVIPMGVPDECFDAQTLPPVHVLSVGTLIPSKRHDVAIAAAARATSTWPVVIVAPRPDTQEAKRLQGIARDAGVRLDIRVGISDRELAATYAAAIATVYMAEREPFGLASVEAQAAGSPVIVADEGGLPETVQDGHGGWAVPRDVAAVAAKLDYLQQPGVRDAVSAEARAHAAGADWTRSARVVETMLQRLAIA
jgi:glycosyltransferase involved in cell wall biosynthesis